MHIFVHKYLLIKRKTNFDYLLNSNLLHVYNYNKMLLYFTLSTFGKKKKKMNMFTSINCINLSSTNKHCLM